MDDTICIEEVPRDIDCDALRILHEASFAWDGGLLAFRRGAATIDYAFIRAQKLTSGSALGAQERIG